MKNYKYNDRIALTILNEHKDKDFLKHFICKTSNCLFKFTETSEQDDFDGLDCVLDWSNRGTVKKIALRTRKMYYKKFNDLTIRNRTQGGNLTEYQNLLTGKTILNYYIYTYLEDETHRYKFYLIDMVKFTQSEMFRNPPKCQINNDGSNFYSFNLSRMKGKGFILYTGTGVHCLNNVLKNA